MRAATDREKALAFFTKLCGLNSQEIIFKLNIKNFLSVGATAHY